jgi:hypothetical protein
LKAHQLIKNVSESLGIEEKMNIKRAEKIGLLETVANIM